MLTKIKLGLLLAMAVVMVTSGCGGTVQATGDRTPAEDVASAKEDSARKVTHPDLYACQTDADCVAVEKAGCCPNGFLVAVNKDQVKAYETEFACTEQDPICPAYVVHDTRVAQCDFQTHQCQMIAPTDIHCGGFIAPARQHHCPTGYQCQLGSIPDVGGTCVAADAE